MAKKKSNPRQWKKVKYSKGREQRFLTQREMGLIKRDEGMLNSMVKRGEFVIKGTGKISICQCGVEGCIHYPSWDRID